jgi:hypothetical protein
MRAKAMCLGIHKIIHAVLIFEGNICHGAPRKVCLITARPFAKRLLKMPTEKRLNGVSDRSCAFSCVFGEQLRRTLKQSCSTLLNQLVSI